MKETVIAVTSSDESDIDIDIDVYFDTHSDIDDNPGSSEEKKNSQPKMDRFSQARNNSDDNSDDYSDVEVSQYGEPEVVILTDDECLAATKCEGDDKDLLESVDHNAESHTNVTVEPDADLPKDFLTTSDILNEFLFTFWFIEDNKDYCKEIIQKLKEHYRLADTEYTQSEDFQILLKKSTAQLKKNKFLSFILTYDIIEKLESKKRQEKVKKRVTFITLPRTEENNNEITANPNFSADENCFENEKVIRKLSKKLINLDKKITWLEQSEVDLGDNYHRSKYIQTAICKRKICRVYQQLCQFTGESPNAGTAVEPKIQFNGTQYPIVNQCIEKWLNETREFPNFMDILKLLQDESPTLGFDTTSEDLFNIAREAFLEAAQMLQRMRQSDLRDSLYTYIDSQTDPAETDPELARLLDENSQKSAIKEQEIIDFYAEKQSKENLQRVKVSKEEAKVETNSGDALVDSEKVEENKQNAIVEREEEEEEEVFLFF